MYICAYLCAEWQGNTCESKYIITKHRQPKKSNPTAGLGEVSSRCNNCPSIDKTTSTWTGANSKRNGSSTARVGADAKGTKWRSYEGQHGAKWAVTTAGRVKSKSCFFSNIWSKQCWLSLFWLFFCSFPKFWFKPLADCPVVCNDDA